MKLSVLYLVNIPSPYRVSFFNELGKKCDLTVIFERFKSSSREKDWHDYEFMNFKAIFLEGIKIGNDSALDIKVLSYLKLINYDVIVIGNYSTPTGILSINYLKLNKIPFVLNVDGGFIKYGESKFKYLTKKMLISSATLWLSTGEITSEYLNYYGAVEKNIYKYPFTTLAKKDIKQRVIKPFEKRLIREELKIPYNNVVLSIGQFIHRKGFDILINAAANLNNDTGIYIIGGNPTKEYNDIIEKKNIQNVHFLDFMEYAKLEKYYMASDIFVLPTREDIWGLVINEAMGNGLPVITTTSCVAGLEMIEEGKNGYLISKNNINELTNALINFFEKQTIHPKMSFYSLETAKKYSIENMADTTIDIFKSNNELLRK